jgi:hypothetical protein
MLDQKEEDLVNLAEACLENARQIKEFLASKDQPQPTFDQNGPVSYSAATPDFQEARLELRTAAKRLYELASGPEDVLGWHLYQCVSSRPESDTRRLSHTPDHSATISTPSATSNTTKSPPPSRSTHQSHIQTSRRSCPWIPIK